MIKDFVASLFAKPTNLNFQPIRHRFFRNSELADVIHKQGYAVVDFIEQQDIRLLMEVYRQHTDSDLYKVKFEEESTGNDGAYMGVISRRTHDSINAILQSTFDKWFYNYWSAVNAFAVKTPGNAGTVPVHQDVADLDETKFSTISIWLPLQDMNESNGTLHIIPRSHHIFLPYRSNSIAPYTQQIENLLLPYYIPIHIKAGQALLFDSRLFHYSPPNFSGQNRVITLCRICPVGAQLISYFRLPDTNEIEMWSCPNDYLIHSENHEETGRPTGGKLLWKRTIDIAPLTAEKFKIRAEQAGLTLPKA